MKSEVSLNGGPGRRYVSAAIMSVAGLSLIVFFPTFLGVIFLISAVWAEEEMAGALKNISGEPYKTVSFSCPFILLLLWYFLGMTGLFCGLVILFISPLLIRIFRPSDPFSRMENTLIAVIYPGIPFFALCAICVGTLGSGISQSMIKGILLLVIGVASLGDTAALFGGRVFGKRKLCPAISPNKTVAGFVFQIVSAPIAAYIIWLTITVWITPSFLLIDALVIGFVCGPVAVFGDLAASVFKRTALIKDFSSAIPGHGGIMDRFDSTSMVALFTFIYFTLRGVI